MSGPNINHK